MRRMLLFAISVGLMAGVGARVAVAQATQMDPELKRLQGNWRVVDLIENGTTISAEQMKSLLPGGGLVEIVDTTLLFKSPVDGHKSTKSFRIDFTSRPKKIAFFNYDKISGQGIYEHEGGKLVICVSHPPTAVPTDFSAPAGSNRTMMVLVPYNKSNVETLKVDMGPPPTVNRPANTVPAIPASVVTPQPAPVPVANPSPAGKILTDEEVKKMLIGKWRMNDGSGIVDITIDARGVFSSYRHAASIQTFHQVFVPTPVSSGTWTVARGQLFLNVTSSWRVDLVNTSVIFAVRSISSTDAILVDNLGRVSRAVRLP